MSHFPLRNSNRGFCKILKQPTKIQTNFVKRKYYFGIHKVWAKVLEWKVTETRDNKPRKYIFFFYWSLRFKDINASMATPIHLSPNGHIYSYDCVSKVFVYYSTHMWILIVSANYQHKCLNFIFQFFLAKQAYWFPIHWNQLYVYLQAYSTGLSCSIQHSVGYNTHCNLKITIFIWIT